MTLTYPLVTSWLATYLIHSTIILGLTFVLCRFVIRSRALQDILWKSALLLGILSSASMLLSQDGHQGSSLNSAKANVATGSTPTAFNVTNGTAIEDRQPASSILRSARLQAAPVATLTPTSQSNWWVRIIPQLWLLVALAGIARIFVGRQRLLVSMGRRNLVTRGDYLSALARARDNVGFPGAVCMTSSKEVLSPLALGLSEIVICESVFQGFTQTQRVSILTHEIAHLSRRDPVWRLAASIVSAVLWFQPLNWLARREIIESAEFLADGSVGAEQGSDVALAESLVAIAREMTRPELRAVALVGAPSMLVRRIRSLLGHAQYPRPSLIVRAVGVAPLVLLGAFAPQVVISSPLPSNVASDSVGSNSVNGKDRRRILRETELEHTHEVDGGIQERTILYANGVLLSNDGRHLKSVLPSGRLDLRTFGTRAVERRIIIAVSADGTVSRRYWLAGREVPEDASASQWFSSHFSRFFAPSRR